MGINNEHELSFVVVHHSFIDNKTGIEWKKGNCILIHDWEYKYLGFMKEWNQKVLWSTQLIYRQQVTQKRPEGRAERGVSCHKGLNTELMVGVNRLRGF